MPHVLIVVSWLGLANGAVIWTQEFTSAERCDAARLALIEYAKARSADELLSAVHPKVKEGGCRSTIGWWLSDLVSFPRRSVRSPHYFSPFLVQACASIG